MARGPLELPSAALSERQRRVLFAVVEEHIQTAQAVASRSTAERSGLALSSASVRGLMVELTALDLLAQPHVSAGRVPTERAYRLYVDALLAAAEPDPPSASATYSLGEESSATGVMQRAADLLGMATGQVGFYLGRPANQLVVEHIHFTRIGRDRVMALLVSGRQVVQTRVFEESSCDHRTLEIVSSQLSGIVGGLTLAGARARLASSIEFERALSDELRRKVLVLGWESLASPGEAELYVSDRRGLLEQPEFSDLERLRELLAALEEKQRMLRLLEKVMGAEIRVAIGSELDDPGVRDCALVTAPFGALGVGTLGVIGPLRMPYDRVIPAVRYVSRRVTDYLC